MLENARCKMYEVRVRSSNELLAAESSSLGYSGLLSRNQEQVAISFNLQGKVGTDKCFCTISVSTFQSAPLIQANMSGPTLPKDPNEAGPSKPPAGFESWRTNLAMFTGLGLTDEQRAERDRAKENETLAKDWDRCEKWKKDLLERSQSRHPSPRGYFESDVL
jgi:hypothetical protein